jgi:glucose-6-phosphate dehydrogenase assembly protein OpcA
LGNYYNRPYTHSIYANGRLTNTKEKIMATTYKVLGQVNPSATTATTLYTVPASTQTVVSTISVCNQASTAATYRIAVRVAGSALSAEEYIVYGATVPASDSTFITVGLTLGATDVLTVYASSATVSFNAYGSEIA